MMVVMIMLSELAILSSVAIEYFFFFKRRFPHTDEPTTPMPVPPSDLEEVLTL